MSTESNKITITIPSWLILFLMAFPLFMEWEDGFFRGLASVICWAITIFFVCITAVVLFINSKANVQVKKTNKSISDIFFETFQMMIVAVLMYLLGHTVLSLVFVFCFVFSFLVMTMIKNKINH